MTRGELLHALATIDQLLDIRVGIWRAIIDVNGHVTRRIYRGSFNARRDSRIGEPHSQGETP